MRRNRFVAVGLSLAAAALCSLLFAGGAAAEALQSKLEAVEEKKGVLTTTISDYRDQIERLTDEVAVIRTREAAVEQRLAAKQTELDQAVAELDGAKEKLEQLRARLKRAL